MKKKRDTWAALFINHLILIPLNHASHTDLTQLLWFLESQADFSY